MKKKPQRIDRIFSLFGRYVTKSQRALGATKKGERIVERRDGGGREVLGRKGDSKGKWM